MAAKVAQKKYGKVGKDAFGSQLKSALIGVGIDTTGLMEDENDEGTADFTVSWKKRQSGIYR